MMNPFQYGAKVTGDCFFDRIEIKKPVLNVIAGGNNAVLYGPWRYGRLVADVRIDHADGKYVHVDPLLAHHLRVTAKG